MSGFDDDGGDGDGDGGTRRPNAFQRMAQEKKGADRALKGVVCLLLRVAPVSACGIESCCMVCCDDAEGKRCRPVTILSQGGVMTAVGATGPDPPAAAAGAVDGAAEGAVTAGAGDRLSEEGGAEGGAAVGAGGEAGEEAGEVAVLVAEGAGEAALGGETDEGARSGMREQCRRSQDRASAAQLFFYHRRHPPAGSAGRRRAGSAGGGEKRAAGC